MPNIPQEQPPFNHKLHPLQELLQQMIATPQLQGWLQELAREWPEAHTALMRPVAEPCEAGAPHGDATAWLRAVDNPEDGSEVISPEQLKQSGIRYNGLAEMAVKLSGSSPEMQPHYMDSTFHGGKWIEPDPLRPKQVELVRPSAENHLLALAGQLRAINLPWATTPLELELLDCLETSLGLPLGLEFARWALEAGQGAAGWPRSGRDLDGRAGPRYLLAQALLDPLLPPHPSKPEVPSQMLEDLDQIGNRLSQIPDKPLMPSSMLEEQHWDELDRILLEGFGGEKGQLKSLGRHEASVGALACLSWSPWRSLASNWQEGNWEEGEEIAALLASWHNGWAREQGYLNIWLGIMPEHIGSQLR